MTPSTPQRTAAATPGTHPSPEPTDRRAARRQATRDEIVAAAWAAAREQGLAGLSLRDLADRVGMKAPSLYSYFGSKAEIYDAMFAEGYRAFAAAIDEVVEAAERDGVDDAEVLRRGARAFVTFCTSDPARHQLLFQRTVPDFEPSAESYAIALANYDQMSRRMADAGIQDPTALDLWTALLTGLADQQISNDPGGDRWIRLVDRAVDMFLAAAAPHLRSNPRRKS